MTTDTQERAVVRGFAMKMPNGQLTLSFISHTRMDTEIAFGMHRSKEGWTIVPVEIRELPDATTEDG